MYHTPFTHGNAMPMPHFMPPWMVDDTMTKLQTNMQFMASKVNLIAEKIVEIEQYTKQTHAAVTEQLSALTNAFKEASSTATDLVRGSTSAFKNLKATITSNMHERAEGSDNGLSAKVTCPTTLQIPMR